jgi:hypothetical protein
VVGMHLNKNIFYSIYLIFFLNLIFFSYLSAETISNCTMDLLNESTTYYLTQDIYCHYSSLSLTANGATIDCAGHTISYCGEGYDVFAIYVYGNYTTIKNCKFQQTCTNLNNVEIGPVSYDPFRSVLHNSFINNEVYFLPVHYGHASGIWGIGDYSYVANNKFSGSDYGVNAGLSSTIINNNITGGIRAGNNSNVINNQVSGGLYVGSNSLIKDNTVVGGGVSFCGPGPWGPARGLFNIAVLNNTFLITDINYGPILCCSSNLTFIDDIILINSSSSATDRNAVFLYNSSDIVFQNVLLGANRQGDIDFESYGSYNIIASNMTFNASNSPTSIYFTLDEPINVSIDSADSIPSPGMLNVSKYIYISAYNGNLSVNISYLQSLGANESLLRLYKYVDNFTLPNGSVLYRWDLVPESGVDTGNKIVFANITGFGIFAPLADVTPPEVNITSPQSNSTLTSLGIKIDGTSIDSSINYTNISIWQGSSLINSTTTNDTSWYVDFSVPGDGVYNITATAYDQIGNSATAIVENITVNTSGGGGGGWCGNGFCEPWLGENVTTCPIDCSSAPICGNGVCEVGENSTNCPSDCSQSAYCGDGVCNNGETCSSCPQDCGSCPPSQYCGDGVCNNGETCSSCPQDCGSCPPSGGGGTSCPSGMTKCGGVCVDTYSDPSNCGSCGISCQDGQICSNGVCVCPSGLTLCNGECVNLLYNPDNCGSCGNKCVLGVCVNGQCQLNCPEGYYFLNNQCIPYTICETGQTPCGSTCCLSTQTCDQNTLSCYPPICPAGKTQCGYNCVDLSSDLSNCGSCGHSCPVGQICHNSKCIGIPTLETCPEFAPNKCGTTCTDLSKDPSNCGACGNKCKASESCINGECTLIPSCPLGSFACGNNCCGVSQTCDPNTLTCTPSICQSGQTQCGSVCIDTSSDRFNCGGCGITCDIEEQCISGKCVSSTCGNGKCDLTENCSTCSQDCGSCQCSAPTPDLCNGRCTNILSDSSNCGACSNECQIGYSCDNGVCKGMINANCTTDSDCSQGNCINNKCQFITCTKDSDCLSTQYCNTNLNLCTDGCSSDSACQSIAGPSYKCQLSTHQCVTCPENTVYQNGACVNDSGTYQPIPYQPSPDNPSSLTSRPTFSSKSSPKVFFQEQKQAALDQLFDIFGTSKTRLLAYDQCLRGSLCSTSDDCCGAPCLDSRCACSVSVCTTTADCCSGYCENGKCTSPKSTSLFFLDSISSAFSRSGCSGLIEECSPDEKTCISSCNGLNILLIASSAGLGAYLWSFFSNPVIGLSAAFLPIIIGISTYPFVGIISAIFIFTFVYSRSLEKIQI